MPASSVWAYCLQIVIGILICGGNVAILLVIRKSTTIGRPTRFLLANLAVGDIIIGGIVLFRAILSTLVVMTTLQCRIWVSVGMLGAISSFGTVCITSVYTLNLARNPIIDSNRRMKKLFLAEGSVWTLSLFLSALLWAFQETPWTAGCISVFGYFNNYFMAALYFLMEAMMAISVVCQLITAWTIRQKMMKIRPMIWSPAAKLDSATETR